MPGSAEHITNFQAVLIGLLEGLTEFLPVSSTAHMSFVPQLFGMQDPGSAFSAVIQLGPMAAIIAYFRHTLWGYVRGIVRSRTPFGIQPDDTDARLGWWTLLASIPILIVGKLLEDQIDGAFRGLNIIAWSFIVGGVVLWAAERAGRRDRPLESMTLPQSQGIGWFQVLALIPGVSRSGATMAAALFQGFDRESATRFSFLLSVPAISAAGLYKLYKDVLKSPDLGAQVVPYLLGTVVAGLTAWAVIVWFLGYVKKHSTGVFIAYRIVVGVILLTLLSRGVLKDRPATSRPATPPTTAQGGAAQTGGAVSAAPALVTSRTPGGR